MEETTTPRPAPGGQGKKIRKPGRPASADPRQRVSIRLSRSEAQALFDAAELMHLPVTTYLRQAALGRRLVVLPEVNRQAWRDLAKTSGLLNQIAAAIHAGKVPANLGPVVKDLAEQVRALRLALVAGGDDGEGEHA
jgi:hypothetical protein